MDVAYIYYLFNQYGIFTLFAPFLVVFTLLYGLLRKLELFKNNEKIAVVIAFALTFYYLYNINIIEFTQRFFSAFFYQILALLLLLISLSIFFESFGGLKKISPLLGLTVFFAFWYASMYNPAGVGDATRDVLTSVWNFLLETGLLIVLIIFGGFIVIVKWITAPSGSKPKATQRKTVRQLLEDLANEIEGKSGK